MSHRYYDSQYAHIAAQVNADVRRDTWGQDIGQNSWLTVDEYRTFIEWLELNPDSATLEVGSGSGGPALFLVETTGCRLVGVDVNEHGVANGNRLAQERGLDRVLFQHGDASEPLAFADETFDAVVCIDAINHLRDRPRVLAEWARVLKPGGRLLFTDPITVSGILTNEEIATRASIGFFLFTPEGINERLIQEAGLTLIRREDVTENMATVARRFDDARQRRRDDLVRLEGAETFDGTQRFLQTSYRLAAERRLSRIVFVARKPH